MIDLCALKLHINMFTKRISQRAIYAIIPAQTVTHSHEKQSMNKPVVSKAVSADKRIRRTQERAEITRSK